MDKRVIFAVAGAGKTTHIINSLSHDRRSMIVTYTDNNYHHLCQRIIQKFGYMPENITVLTYFNFLYSFCYKPFLHEKYKARGIFWETIPRSAARYNASQKGYYISTSKYLFHNRIAKLVRQEALENVISRLQKYFDTLYVDEVQDFGGHDFNLLKALCASEINICLVGDFYQHTFDTSRDGTVNKSLFNDFEQYKAIFESIGISVDTETLSHSFRCTSEVCTFIRDNLGIHIQSHKDEASQVLFISDQQRVFELFGCNQTVKLFYQKHSTYSCFSQNWGKSKGQDHYSNVCVVLNPTTMKAYNNSALSGIAPASRNKLYVACTRANNNLYFFEETKLKAII